MAYSLTSDGVNDKGVFASTSNLGTSWDVESTKKGLEDGFDIIVGGNSFTRFVRVDFSTGNTKILCRIDSPTVRTFDLGANYKNIKKTYKVTLRPGGVLSAFVDGVPAGSVITDTAMVALPIDRSFDYGGLLSTAASITETLKIIDNNNSANNIELVNDTGAGSIWADVSGNVNDLTLISFPTDDSQWNLIPSSGIFIVGDTALFDFNALAGAVDLAGEILVTGSTASFDYTAISGSVDLTGQLLVTGQTANFDYNAINGDVEFTGEISVIGDTASFDYIALPGSIDLTGEIVVTGSTANFDYTGVNGIVELGAVINVVGQTANFDFNGVNAEVSLTGEIIITGDTATFNYQALSGLVVIGQGQKIGTVTAGFAESTIGVQYKQSTITVNFGE